MSEIDEFKRDINLTSYAAAQGYQVNQKESSRNSIVMNHSNGDKIIVAKGRDNHWTYFSVRDPADHGSIVDFIQRRSSKNLGEVRKELRPWIGKTMTLPRTNSASTASTAPEVEPRQVDRQKVKDSFDKMKLLYDPSYLKSRGLNNETLNHPRFAGMINQDERRNIIFPHYDREGLSGFEIKNKNFTGFAKFGLKGVWHSRAKKTDTRLVLTESAIDALSYHQLKGTENTRYISISGQMSPRQEEIVKSAINKMPQGSDIVLAFDKDRAGDIFAEKVKGYAPHAKFIRDVPQIGKDWNEQLVAMQKQFSHDPNKKMGPERSLSFSR